ncbi:protein phosphatase 1 regulatory subunit 3D [Tamandua tetradactyla]|uniref:protein phosphatase 1 regulatory subunit 3D n=1 Tax=Tamandua tetradactyla TaxID=48850 RepID=UPI004053F7EE
MQETAVLGEESRSKAAVEGRSRWPKGIPVGCGHPVASELGQRRGGSGRGVAGWPSAPPPLRPTAGCVMSRAPGSAVLPPAPGFRKPALRSLSCLSDLDGGPTREPRPCRPPGTPGRAPLAPAPSGCDPSLRPIILRRARSLPSSPERRQKAAGAPGAGCRPGCSRQLRVRFADALGLELAQVKVFNAGDDPSVPLHVLSRLAINADLCCSSQDLEFTLRCLVPDFPPPVEAADFGERLRRQLVCLERVTCSDLGISGTVRVRNVAFEKQVAVRYTFSGWRSAHEAAGRWRGPAGEAGAEDVFSFGFPVPPFLLALGSRVHFALRYRVAGGEHWDNNEGRDYSLTCRGHELRMPRGECEESWIHFI